MPDKNNSKKVENNTTTPYTINSECIWDGDIGIYNYHYSDNYKCETNIKKNTETDKKK